MSLKEVIKINHDEFLKEAKRRCHGKHASVAFRMKVNGIYSEDLEEVGYTEEQIEQLEVDDFEYEIIHCHIYNEDFSNAREMRDFINKTTPKYAFDVLEVGPKH